MKSTLGKVVTADIIILGSGPGGSAVAHALKDSGADVLVVERGGYLPIEPANWDANAVFNQGRYKTSEHWYDTVRDRYYVPGNHYWVGGQTKMYGANLQRLRLEDFEALEHPGGTSPAWPISYDELEPFYREAEILFGVRGAAGIDPTEPPRSSAFPFPPIPHEPAIEELVEALHKQKLRPHPLEMAIHWNESGCNSEVPCNGCDGFPCKVGGKGDAETQLMRPALESPNIRLMIHTLAYHLDTSPGGKRIQAVRVFHRGDPVTIKGGTFVLACGAVNSPILMLRSKSEVWPEGIGNQYDQVGRNYMLQNQSAMMSVRPVRKTSLTMQKTVGVHDFLIPTDDHPYPLGALQTLGKLTAPLLQTDKPYLPLRLLESMAERSIDWWMTTEEVPDSNNRVRLGDRNRIEITWRPNNEAPHDRLVMQAKQMMRKAGYPLNFHRRFGIEANAHQCGTLRMGTEPNTSVCDSKGRVHGIENLYVADASAFPSSTAMAPTLTLAALSLRLGKLLAG